MFVKRSVACEDCSANDSLTLVEENDDDDDDDDDELHTQPFLSLRPDLNMTGNGPPANKPLMSKGSLITTKVINFCAAKVNSMGVEGVCAGDVGNVGHATAGQTTGGRPIGGRSLCSYNFRTFSSSPSPVHHSNQSKMIVESHSSPFGSKSLGYSSLRVKARDAANSFLLMDRSVDQQQQGGDTLEEFQRIRSTLRKSVRRTASPPTKAELKEESLEAGRRELSDVFHKIRNIKIG